MDYKALYHRFIQDRQGREVAGYSERHHIVPRCEGGGDEPENLLRLSARDHLFAHLILAKWKGGLHWLPLILMTSQAKRPSQPTAQELRIAAKAREKAGQALVGREKTKEERQKLSRALKGRTILPAWRAKMSQAHSGKALTKEHRDNIGRGLQGKSPSQETRTKIGKFHKGKVLSEETRQKIRDSLAKTRASRALI